MKRAFQIVLVCLAATLPVRLRAADAEFKGRTAAGWIDEGVTNGTGWFQALEALREMGPDAVPTLITKLRSLPKGMPKEYSASLSSLPSFLIESLVWLGPDAKPALPTFLELVRSTNYPTISLFETIPLVRGNRENPAITPAVIHRLRDFELNLPGREPMGLMLGFEGIGVLRLLDELGPAAKDAVPVLRKWVADPKHELQLQHSGESPAKPIRPFRYSLNISRPESLMVRRRPPKSLAKWVRQLSLPFRNLLGHSPFSSRPAPAAPIHACRILLRGENSFL